MNTREMKYRLPFGSMWKMKIEHPYSLLVQDGGYAWTCGQCPLDENGQVAHENNLIAQTRHVVQSIRTILDHSKLQSPAVAKLVVYYVEQEPDCVQEMIALLEQEFGESSIILPIPVPYFYYSGMLIEVDIHVAEAHHFSRSAVIEKSGLKVQVTDFDQLVWVKLSAAAGDHWDARGRADVLLEVLKDFELGPDELLADHWFTHPDAPSRLLDAFSARGFVTDQGAAATTRLPNAAAAVGELTFVKRSWARSRSMSTSRRIGDSTLTLRQKGDFFWAGVRIDKSGMALAEQTRKAMIDLNNAMLAHGLSFDQVCKVTTHYVGDNTPADLHDNMIVRNAYYSQPGPASTGLPVDALLAPESLVTIDILGRHAP
ncbi:TIGR00004: reactive intermediate/imine deaminase [compost metagenome]